MYAPPGTPVPVFLYSGGRSLSYRAHPRSNLWGRSLLFFKMIASSYIHMVSAEDTSSQVLTAGKFRLRFANLMGYKWVLTQSWSEFALFWLLIIFRSLCLLVIHDSWSPKCLQFRRLLLLAHLPFPIGLYKSFI